MADVAPTVRQLGRESARFFANPSNLGLISANGDRLGDLDTPAPIFLLPELGDDPEPDKRVMQVQGQALRCHCKLDSWIAAHRVNGAIAAHQHLDELAQSVAIPAPNRIWKAFFGGELAHHPKLLQPGSEWVRLTSARTRREIRDCMPADLEGREMVGYQLMEVAEDLRIGVGEAWSRPSKAPFGVEASLDAAVHPRVNFAWLYRSIPTEAEYRWHLPPNGVLDGRPFTGRRVVDQAV